ncbi:putative sporulation protein YtxC [Siminovitchia sediminis]|uniref:Sporulation protein YtxC n=1 Tax=Siminovitchia sediminis TaxID=1274353 RepID=A0ABW4KG80_9BACI
MDILFTSEEEAVQLQNFLLKNGFEQPFSKEQGFFVFSFPKEGLTYIDVLGQFIIQVKRGEFLHRILLESFFYESREERNQIIDIVTAMFNGNRKELTSMTGQVNESEMVQEAILSLLRSTRSIHFDTLVTFRLKEYKQALIKYLHVAIDEYKMEQDYQMFIQMLRDYLKHRPPIKRQVHLYIDDGEIIFYDEHFKEMDKECVMNMVDRRLLANHPVYIDSAVIAPLLSMAPEKIHLFTSQEEKPLIRTLVNIFEERMVILPSQHSVE